MQIDPTLADDLDTSGPLTKRTPRLGLGDHTVAITAFETKKTKDYGLLMFVEYSIIESTTHTKGDVFGDAWFIQKPGLNGEYERKRANEFARVVVQCLGGNPDDMTPCLDANGAPVMVNGKVFTKGMAQVRDTRNAMLSAKQPGRGLIVRANVHKGKATKADPSKNYSEKSYLPVIQTRDQIKALRDRLDRTAPATTAPAAAQNVQTSAPVAPPAAAPIETNHLDGLF